MKSSWCLSDHQKWTILLLVRTLKENTLEMYTLSKYVKNIPESMIFLLKLILILSCFTDGLFSYVCLYATSIEHTMMLDIIQFIIHTHIST